MLIARHGGKSTVYSNLLRTELTLAFKYDIASSDIENNDNGNKLRD